MQRSGMRERACGSGTDQTPLAPTHPRTDTSSSTNPAMTSSRHDGSNLASRHSRCSAQARARLAGAERAKTHLEAAMKGGAPCFSEASERVSPDRGKVEVESGVRSKIKSDAHCSTETYIMHTRCPVRRTRACTVRPYARRVMLSDHRPGRDIS